eukprot:SAG11_NODE_14198_length_622_cov_0.588910_1_plen_80_part_00
MITVRVSFDRTCDNDRPGDVGVVGAMGDSVTAGFGARATSIINLPVESRGASWSIGGDEGIVRPLWPDRSLSFRLSAFL